MTEGEKLALLASYSGTALCAVALCSWRIQGDTIATWWWLFLGACIACNATFTAVAWLRYHERKD